MARKVKNLKQRNQFVIVTNGKRSEKNYFNALRVKFRSIYDIDVKFENGDPLTVVKRAIREKKTSNQVWFIFDTDTFPDETIYKCMAIARNEDIGIAFSNAAFEVWLINHFDKLEAEKTPANLLDVLDSYIRDEGYAQGYSKNDCVLVEEVFLPRLETAKLNSEVSLQKRIVEYNRLKPNDTNYPLCEWNSCTTVHKLVEALKLQERE